MNIKTYVINLDRNPERLAHIQTVLGELGIEYERIAGVDGEALSDEARAKVFDVKRSYIANKGYKMCLGELGCALSHLSVYRKMVESNIQLALIFEDDIKIDDNFNEMLELALKDVDATKRQVVLFSCHRMKGAEEGFKGLKRVKSMGCADGYLITLPAAKDILKYNYPIVVPADDWRRFRKHCAIELYKCLPPTVEQLHSKFETNAIGRETSATGLRKLRLQIEDWLLNMIEYTV